MNKNYYTAHAANLGSMRPALGQIASDVLKKLRSCVIKRMTRSTVRFWLNNPLDEFVFYDSKGNRMLASDAFADAYIAGYRRALSDLAHDISYELEARKTWER
jgi:hypothetical protein